MWTGTPCMAQAGDEFNVSLPGADSAVGTRTP
jgi:hypothetical protein